MTSRTRTVLIAVGIGAAVAALPATQAQAQPSKDHSAAPVVVVSGLNNPRQLSLVDGRVLLIAEAGKGGTDAKFAGPEGPTFIGFSGSISAVRRPGQAQDQQPHRIVTGLMSGAAEDGSAAVGSDGVSSRHAGGPIYIQETFAPPAALPSGFDLSQNGKLLKAGRHGQLSSVADISAFEAANDPDGHGFDSDPYAVLATDHGLYVADAAGNDVLRVHRDGTVAVFHVFPNVTTGACESQADPGPDFPGCNFVPTSLATDRRGNLYVGGLSSLTPGEAQVVKLDRRGHVRKVWTGFTSVTGLAVGKDGALYVSELIAPEANPINPQVTGVLIKIRADGTRKNIDVPFPAGIALDKHNNVYVSAFSIAPDTGLAGPGTSGQVWRLRF